MGTTLGRHGNSTSENSDSLRLSEALMNSMLTPLAMQNGVVEREKVQCDQRLLKRLAHVSL